MPGKDKNRGSKRFMDAIKQGQEFSASMKAGRESNVERRPNMTSNFTKIPDPKKVASQGIGGMIGTVSPMAFRMPPFPKLSKGQEKLDMDGDGQIDGEDLAKLREKGVTRYKEDENTGMLKRETLLPRNKMGSIALKVDPMPMAYKHKVVKKTGVAKVMPFTERNAL